MRYEVHVARHSGGRESRFELERDEPVVLGDMLPQFNMVYQVTGIQPLSADASQDFDAIVTAEWRAGPAQAAYTP